MIWVRFMSKVSEQDSGCWIWMGSCNRRGYGQFSDRTAHCVLAHRWAYASFVGPVPEGLTLDHLCRNKRCVNPLHLEAVTQLVNSRRHFVLQKHCKHGHEYTPENTRYSPRGHRKCKTCELVRSRQKQAALTAGPFACDCGRSFQSVSSRNRHKARYCPAIDLHAELEAL